MADWLFWTIAAGLALGSLALVFRPLFRGAAPAARRASYDMQVFRDQLREIESDRARGVLTEDEAAATRVEISRRLLAAADAEAAEPEAAAAPPRLSRGAVTAGLAALILSAAGLYGLLGAPGLPDEPLRLRQAREAAAWAERPTQAEVEAMVAERDLTPPAVAPEEEALVARLQQALESRPNDATGHRLLARSLGALGRWSEARAAQERVVEITGSNASAQDLVDLAELRILAAGGYVSPEAEAALTRALALDPSNPVGRYYSGLTLLQAGRPDLAYPIWSALLEEGPPDAPWVAPIRAEIDEVARLAGRPPRAAAPGPSPDDADAAMPAEEREAMIEGMVAQLSDRLAEQGGPPEDWARLIRSLGVLGRRDEAAAVLAEARQKHADDPAALADFEAAARDAGLTQ